MQLKYRIFEWFHSTKFENKLEITTFAMKAIFNCKRNEKDHDRWVWFTVNEVTILNDVIKWRHFKFAKLAFVLAKIQQCLWNGIINNRSSIFFSYLQNCAITAPRSSSVSFIVFHDNLVFSRLFSLLNALLRIRIFFLHRRGKYFFIE